MNKFLSFTLAFLAASSVAAAPLTPQEALSRASGDSRVKIASNSFNQAPVFIVNSAASRPAAYVFNANDKDGFMILAADDVAYPVLGYSDSGSFDPNNIPDQMKWWLSEYARMIEWANENNLPPANAPVFDESWTKIQPLCSTKWDQSSPYNNDCPTDIRTSRKCVTGCVATSMAQAVKYFNYPATGQGSVSYYPGNVGKTLTMDFSTINFDWDNMLDSYPRGGYTDAQASAVAQLMIACGYSVQMNYGSDASGAQGRDIAKALRTYFNYDANCRSEFRMMYSMSDWTSKVYNNLANVGPVIINGSDPGDAGHSFIVDGYDGNGYFHLNWGWGGMSDGYFALDALNPDSMGIGGYGSGFNYSQNCIFGIQPPKGGPVETQIPNLVQSGNLKATLNGNKLVLSTSDYYFNGSQGWANYTDVEVNGKFGVGFQLASGEGTSTIIDATYGTSTTVSVFPGGICPSNRKINVDIPSLTDGKYKATLMFHPDGYDWQEILVPWAYNNYIYVEKSGSNWTVSYPDWKHFSIESASIDSKLYNGFNVLIKAKFVNDSDLEITQGVTACLMSGNDYKFLGPNIIMTLQPNETSEKDLIFTFTPMAGVSFTSPSDYTLRFINRENSTSYGDFGTYTMTTGPKTTMLTLQNLSVEGATQESIEYAGGTRNVYIISNPADFIVDFKYSVKLGFFDKIMRLALYEVGSESLNALTPVEGLSPIFTETPFLDANEVSENQVNVMFPDALQDKLYAIRAEYGGAGSWKNLGTPIYFMKTGAGIGDIISDSEKADAVYFNLQGQRIDNPTPGQIVIRRIGSKIEKVVL